MSELGEHVFNTVSHSRCLTSTLRVGSEYTAEIMPLQVKTRRSSQPKKGKIGESSTDQPCYTGIYVPLKSIVVPRLSLGTFLKVCWQPVLSAEQLVLAAAGLFSGVAIHYIQTWQQTKTFLSTHTDFVMKVGN